MWSWPRKASAGTVSRNEPPRCSRGLRSGLCETAPVSPRALRRPSPGIAWAVCGLMALPAVSNAAEPAGRAAEPAGSHAAAGISGIHPHLAMDNAEGECGTGAVVPWAGRLWVVTYGPHLPKGSSDRLYEIAPDLRRTVRPESIGGTPANRMIHDESRQLFIGPHVIDEQGAVRTIPYDRMPGRLTGVARHLTDPAGKVYVATMEEGLYEVDVRSLAVVPLIRDGNLPPPKPAAADAWGSLVSNLPGYHGKGCYSGQGRVVYANNGDRAAAAQAVLGDPTTPSGALAEWRTPGADWTLVRRNQFTEVTGPGGIAGNAHPDTDPVWSIGWDARSLILMVLDGGAWHAFRLPKVSHAYDGAHGWNTEWPRIREVGDGDLLMTMHGAFWRFPREFSAARPTGIRPRSAYLKVIGDFCRWGDDLVFGCDDAAASEFKNKRRVKGEIAAPKRANSNLWFASPDLPDRLGPPHASAAVWLHDDVAAGAAAEPLLVAGWDSGSCWFVNGGAEEARFAGDLGDVVVPPGGSVRRPLPRGLEWLRGTAATAGRDVSVVCTLAARDDRGDRPDPIFAGLAAAGDERALRGLLHGGSAAAGTLSVVSDTGLHVLAVDPDARGSAALRLEPRADPQVVDFVRTKVGVPRDVVTIDAAGVLVEDDRGRRWRLPKHAAALDADARAGRLRLCREVVTERDLFHAGGTFYELPAENAGGFAVIRPVASHGFAIADYASFRGLLVMTGLAADAPAGGHVIRSPDGKAAVWAGVIDDLWRLGKPRGEGGPWNDTAVKADVPSDPFLIWGFDDRRLRLAHRAAAPVTVRVELDLTGTGPWVLHETVTVPPGDAGRELLLPRDVQARWIRVTADRDCTATAWLTYR